MDDIVETALQAEQETASVEFKEGLDINSGRDWCEIVKDIIAIANTGGGVILFGLDSNGNPVGTDVTLLRTLDPAIITDKIQKYTAYQFSRFTLEKCEKLGYDLAAIKVQSTSIPIVFQKPGTYDAGGGRQKHAFSAGTVYFRHGAKSEPGDTNDLRNAFERRVESLREAWLDNVRQVVEAPLGSTVLTIEPGTDTTGLPFRLTDDP